MKLLGFELSRAERRDSPESIKSSATAEDLWAFFGVGAGAATLPMVTIDTALQVPAVLCAVDFLSSCQGALPRHAFKVTKEGDTTKVDRAGGKLQRLINEAPNPDWSAFDFWKYIWTQWATGGRGLAWIERAGGTTTGPVNALWPMDPSKVTIRRIGTRKVYEFTGGARPITYEAHEIIDLPFMLKRDQLGSYSPIKLGERAIQQLLAQNDYGSQFFAGGGVLPYALEGPLPKGRDANERAAEQIERAIKQARQSGRPFFAMPPGHQLKQIGADPEKGQMVEARQASILEIARLYRLPPVFLQDLTHGTFSNTEQQDLQLVKHLIAHHARQIDDQLNLKLFGADKNQRYIETNLDGLQRGDFKSRIEALARGINTGQLMPDEARALDNRAPAPGGDQLYIQGATVPLTMAGKVQVKPAPREPFDDQDAGTGDDAGTSQN